MAKPNSRQTLISYCKRALGHPVIEINIDDEPNQPTVLGVRGIPTMVMFVDSKQVSTKIGAVPKSAIVSWIKESISS